MKIYPSNHYLVFACSERKFAFPLHEIREILPIAELAGTPGLPPIIAGFLNLGGDMIPVIRLDRLFSLPEMRVGPYSHLILAGAERNVAFLVDYAEEVAPLPPGALHSIRDGETFNDCAKAAFTRDERTVHLLSVEKVLLSEEKHKIDEWKSITRKRLESAVAGK